MKRWFILFGLIFVAIITIVVLYVMFNNQFGNFKSTSTNPGNNSSSVDPEGKITFVFSQNLDSSQSQNFLQTSPNQLFTINIQANKLILTPISPLHDKTQYLISINSIKSVKSEQTSTSLVFTTGINNSPRAQFIRILPYTADDFIVTYNNSLDSFTVQILTNPIDQAKSKALQLFRDHNVDPSSQTIDFQVIRSLQGKGAPPPN